MPELTRPWIRGASHQSRQAGFIILRENTHWRMYRNPKQILLANDVGSLERLLAQISAHIQEGGEVAGFFSYEAGYALEARLCSLLSGRKQLLAWFGFYDSCELLEDCEYVGGTKPALNNLRLGVTHSEYSANIATIQALIEAGEVYQINFTNRVTFDLHGAPWDLFTALCHEHLTPFAAYLNIGTDEIVSLSPELFFLIEGDRIVVQPMKGTAPRGATQDEDCLITEALSTSEKERAENVMIVDLMRNDLGRICRSGSIKTTKLFELHRFPSVWQMTSTIEGRLCEGWTAGTIIRALFPSGSVTGAPKIRAMEHIARLEAQSRGVYTGAIGYFAPNHSQFNVAIRTVLLNNAGGVMGIGSGITYDSSASAEWEECCWKCGFLTGKNFEFDILETLLWQGSYVLLDQHLARMAASAEYFGFPFDIVKARRLLTFVISEVLPTDKKRVRIWLTRNGQLSAQAEDIFEKRCGRVLISTLRVSSKDCFLFHKTTRRQLYEEELALAKAAACDDVLFFNERGELTEGAIHNVIILQDSLWHTPPVKCGLLAGTYRSKFLAEHANARESVLTMADLEGAEAIFLCNSVRGMYEVKLETAGVFQPVACTLPKM